MTQVDIVVVGGGIAGASLAAVMAGQGAEVVVLERQSAYRDHVRGELLWPWGIREAQELDLESVLLGAGANRATTLVSHSEDRATPIRAPVEGARNHGIAQPRARDGVPGARGRRTRRRRHGAHRRSSGASGSRRSTSGSRCRSPRPAPRRSRLDSSSVPTAARRPCGRQAGIQLEVDPPGHLVTGLLVDGAESDADVNVVAREGDTLFLAFPQRAGGARLYHCFPTRFRDRFAGEHAATRFLDACALPCLPDPGLWSASRPAGPCATFPACDARAATPAAPGVVLVGDAAGYENPLNGQGLSIARRCATYGTWPRPWSPSRTGAHPRRSSRTPSTGRRGMGSRSSQPGWTCGRARDTSARIRLCARRGTTWPTATRCSLRCRRRSGPGTTASRTA